MIKNKSKCAIFAVRNIIQNSAVMENKKKI